MLPPWQGHWKTPGQRPTYPPISYARCLHTATLLLPLLPFLLPAPFSHHACHGSSAGTPGQGLNTCNLSHVWDGYFAWVLGIGGYSGVSLSISLIGGWCQPKRGNIPPPPSAHGFPFTLLSLLPLLQVALWRAALLFADMPMVSVLRHHPTLETPSAPHFRRHLVLVDNRRLHTSLLLPSHFLTGTGRQTDMVNAFAMRGWTSLWTVATFRWW